MRAFLLSLVLLSSLGLAGCASAPEGFSLDIQLSGVRLAAVDSIRLVLTPTATGGTMPGFTVPSMTSFEDGGVMLSTDATGNLVILISGEYFRANAIPTGDGDLDPRLSLELWSDDATERAGPMIRGVMLGPSRFEAASGSAFLPEWPLPLGTTFTLTLTCNAGREMDCRPPAP